MPRSVTALHSAVASTVLPRSVSSALLVALGAAPEPNPPAGVPPSWTGMITSALVLLGGCCWLLVLVIVIVSGHRCRRRSQLGPPLPHRFHCVVIGFLPVGGVGATRCRRPSGGAGGASLWSAALLGATSRAQADRSLPMDPPLFQGLCIHG